MSKFHVWCYRVLVCDVAQWPGCAACIETLSDQQPMLCQPSNPQLSLNSLSSCLASTVYSTTSSGQLFSHAASPYNPQVPMHCLLSCITHLSHKKAHDLSLMIHAQRWWLSQIGRSLLFPNPWYHLRLTPNGKVLLEWQVLDTEALQLPHGVLPCSLLHPPLTFHLPLICALSSSSSVISPTHSTCTHKWSESVQQCMWEVEGITPSTTKMIPSVNWVCHGLMGMHADWCSRRSIMCHTKQQQQQQQYYLLQPQAMQPQVFQQSPLVPQKRNLGELVCITKPYHICANP